MTNKHVQQTLHLATTWNGDAIAQEQQARVTLAFSESELVIECSARFWNDPAPKQLLGSTPELWNWEVVELFLLGDNEHYLEIELGPHGHYLLLELKGQRNVVRQGMSINYTASIDNQRWTGRAAIPTAWLPLGLHKLNAYAIHGCPPNRQYEAWKPSMGKKPDFHQLHCFGQLEGK